MGWSKRDLETAMEVLALSPTEAAYVAGIIDGEGTIFIARTKTPKHFRLTVRVSVQMTHKPTIQWLFDKVGGCLYDATHLRRGGKWANKPHHKHIWEWRVHSLPLAARLMRTIMPYLITKREQAEVLLEFCDQRIDRLLAEGNSRIAWSDEDMAFYFRLRDLNTAGVI